MSLVGLAAWLLLLLGCDLGNPGPEGGGVPRTSTPLLADLKSGMHMEGVRLLESVRGRKWEEREVERYSDPRIGEVIVAEVEVSPYSHLGSSGVLTLSFRTDRLVSAAFDPVDFDGYLAKLRAETGQPLRSNESFRVHADVDLFVKQGAVEGDYVMWTNVDLFRFFFVTQ